MFQFAHVESYSRVTPKTGKKGGHSVSSIINEATRKEGNFPHVESPKPPIYIYMEISLKVLRLSAMSGQNQ